MWFPKIEQHMSEEKYYITIERAKIQIPRYAFLTIRDQQGIVIYRSDEVGEKNFSAMLDQVIQENVDPEISFKFGTTENSSRHNIPHFIKLNDDIPLMILNKPA